MKKMEDGGWKIEDKKIARFSVHGARHCDLAILSSRCQALRFGDSQFTVPGTAIWRFSVPWTRHAILYRSDPDQRRSQSHSWERFIPKAANTTTVVKHSTSGNWLFLQ